MNSAWPIATVEELKAPTENALTGGPFGSDLTSVDYQDIPGVPVIRGSNMGGTSGYFIDTNFVYVSERKAQTLARNSARKGDLIFTQRGTLGQVVIIPADARHDRYIISQSQMKLTPNPERVHAKYLFHYFRSPTMLRGIESQTLATGVPHINLGILRRMNVLLPPLAEQRRIAEILDRAEALRAKRRAALALLDSLPQSIFFTLFGDPVINPRGWALQKFAELGELDRGVSKHRPRNDPELLGGPYPLIQTGDVANSGGYIRSFENTYSDFGLRQSRLWPKGTLCITIAANIAKTGILEFEACFPDSVVGFSADPCTTTFVRVWLSFLQQALEENAPTVAQKNINLAILRGLDVPVPPMSQREAFHLQVLRVRELRDAAQKQADVLDELFASLQHRAFNGTL